MFLSLVVLPFEGVAQIDLRERTYSELETNFLAEYYKSNISVRGEVRLGTPFNNFSDRNNLRRNWDNGFLTECPLEVETIGAITTWNTGEDVSLYSGVAIAADSARDGVERRYRGINTDRDYQSIVFQRNGRSFCLGLVRFSREVNRLTNEGSWHMTIGFLFEEMGEERYNPTQETVEDIVSRIFINQRRFDIIHNEVAPVVDFEKESALSRTPSRNVGILMVTVSVDKDAHTIQQIFGEDLDGVIGIGFNTAYTFEEDDNASFTVQKRISDLGQTTSVVSLDFEGLIEAQGLDGGVCNQLGGLTGQGGQFMGDVDFSYYNGENYVRWKRANNRSVKAEWTVIRNIIDNTKSLSRDEIVFHTWRIFGDIPTYVNVVRISGFLQCTGLLSRDTLTSGHFEITAYKDGQRFDEESSEVGAKNLPDNPREVTFLDNEGIPVEDVDFLNYLFTGNTEGGLFVSQEEWDRFKGFFSQIPRIIPVGYIYVIIEAIRKGIKKGQEEGMPELVNLNELDLKHTQEDGTEVDFTFTFTPSTEENEYFSHEELIENEELQKWNRWTYLALWFFIGLPWIYRRLRKVVG